MIQTLTFEYFATGEGYHVDVFISNSSDIIAAYFEKRNITDQSSKDWYTLGIEITPGVSDVNNFINLDALTLSDTFNVLFSYSHNAS